MVTIGIVITVSVALLLACSLYLIHGFLIWCFEKLAPYYIRRPGAEKNLIPTPCWRCGGRTVLWLNNEDGQAKYIKIPPHRDKRDHENRRFRVALTNVVRCPECQGLGVMWEPRNPGEKRGNNVS